MIYKLHTSIGGCQFKDVDAKKGIITGYFNHFNNVDGDGDIIRPGAFKKTISENFNRVKHLLNHRVDQPIAKILTLSEDSKGLPYESQLGSHILGQDMIKMIESGLITEHSIGFQTLKRNQIGEYGDPNGTWEITEVKLWEGSCLTGWGANQLTPLTGLKGITTQNLMDRHKNLENFVRHSKASDETIQMLMLEVKQLSQMIMEHNQTKDTKPGEEPVKPSSTLKVLAEAMKQIKSN